MNSKFPTLIQDFSPGFQTKRDASMIPPGSARAGSNISITDGDRITPRKGRALFGADSSAQTPITNSYMFHKRDGTEIPMRSYSTVLEYYNDQTSSWVNLKSGYTSGQPFGFAEFNENTEFQDFIYFGNGLEPYSRWAGAFGALNGALSGGETAIIVDTVLTDTIHFTGTSSSTTTTTVVMPTGTWSAGIWNNQFYVRITSGAASGKISKITATSATQITFGAIAALTGTPTFEIRQAKYAHTGSIRIGTTDIAYTAFFNDTTFTVASAPVASNGAAVTQIITEYTANPRGNIFATYNGAMFVVGYKSSTLYRSRLFDATLFTLSATRLAGEGDIIDFVEGGGPITSLGIQETDLYVLKRDVIKKLTYSQDASDLLNVFPILMAPLVGPTYFLNTFKVDNFVYFTSPKGGVKAVGRVGTIDFVQRLQISDPILPTVNAANFDTAAGFYFDGKAYISAKESENDASNNIIFVYNFEKTAWDLPIRGWNISSFFVYGGSLYGGSSINPTTFQLFTGNSDVDDGTNALPITASWSSGYINFEIPANLKTHNILYVEGYIATPATIDVQIDYEFNGFYRSISGSISGTDTDYILANETTSPLGVSPLGVNPLGAGLNDNPDALKKFRVYFTMGEIEYNEMAVTFSSAGEGQRWEIIRYGPNALPLENMPIKYNKRLI